MRRVSLVLVTLLVGGVAAASEPCAWVLWVEYQNIGVFGKGPERSVVPTAAYPDNGYAKCVEDGLTRAIRQVEGAKAQPNVKNVTRSSLMGRQESVTTELKSGGTMSTTYMG